MTKRIVSLLIAVMLVVGIFAIPAAAATPNDEGIEPYTSWVPCSCGTSNPVGSYPQSEVIYSACNNNPNAYHRHRMSYRCEGFTCSNCGKTTVIKKTLVGITCLG